MPSLCSVRCSEDPLGWVVGAHGTEQQSHTRDHELSKKSHVLDTTLRLEGALLWNIDRAPQIKSIIFYLPSESREGNSPFGFSSCQHANIIEGGASVVGCD